MSSQPASASVSVVGDFQRACQYVQSGDYSALARLLSPQLLTQADAAGNTLLMFAANGGDVDVVKCLLKHGAKTSLDAVNNRKCSALIIAAQAGHTDVVKHLLIHNPNPFLKSSYGNLAVQLSTEISIKWLIQDFQLLRAVHDDDIAQVKTALRLGSSVEITYRQYGMAFLRRIEKASRDVRQCLHEHVRQAARLVPLRRDNEALSAELGGELLFFASYFGDLALAEQLVDGGADLNWLDQYGQTSLMVASFKGNADLVDYLCSQGANIGVISHMPETALHMAVHGQHQEVVELLACHGAFAILDVRDHKGKTAAMHAQQKGWQTMVELLVSLGARRPRPVAPVSAVSALAKRQRQTPDSVTVVSAADQSGGKKRVRGSQVVSPKVVGQ
jgi:hypothetical protein